MVFDRSDHEPEESDPEADYRDPDSDSLTIPRVDTEDAGSGDSSELEPAVNVPEVSTDPTDVPADLLKTFWATVIVVNAAVLALSLGVMFVVFEGNLRRGAGLAAGGLVLFGFAVRRYRRWKASEPSDRGTTENAAAPQSTADAADTGGTDPATDDSRPGDPGSETGKSTSGDAHE